MNHGPYNFDLARVPQCPICRAILLAIATEFHDATAYCSSCANLITPLMRRRVIDTQNLPTIIPLWSTSKGLRFFTPSEHVPPRLSVDLLAVHYKDVESRRQSQIHNGRPAVQRTSVSQGSV